MSNRENSKSLIQEVPTGFLKVFLLFVSPIAILGQIFLIMLKFSEGITVSGAFDLPNWVQILCSTFTVGVMIYPMALGSRELKQRKKQRSI